MKLSAQQFEEIIASLKSEGRKGPQGEKRRAPRVGLRMQVNIIPRSQLGQPKLQEMLVRDLSVDGIGLISKIALKAGEHFLVVFARPIGQPLSVLYRVVHCKEHVATQFSIGAKLERIIEGKSPAAPTAQPATAKA